MKSTIIIGAGPRLITCNKRDAAKHSRNRGWARTVKASQCRNSRHLRRAVPQKQARIDLIIGGTGSPRHVTTSQETTFRQSAHIGVQPPFHPPAQACNPLLGRHTLSGPPSHAELFRDPHRQSALPPARAPHAAQGSTETRLVCRRRGFDDMPSFARARRGAVVAAAFEPPQEGCFRTRKLTARTSMALCTAGEQARMFIDARLPQYAESES